MVVLHIEHDTEDYDRWRSMFDADPADRAGSGVRRFRVTRGVVDTGLVTIELDFDDLAAAEGMLAKLRPVWQGPEPPASSAT